MGLEDKSSMQVRKNTKKRLLILTNFECKTYDDAINRLCDVYEALEPKLQSHYNNKLKCLTSD